MVGIITAIMEGVKLGIEESESGITEPDIMIKDKIKSK